MRARVAIQFVITGYPGFILKYVFVPCGVIEAKVVVLKHYHHDNVCYYAFLTANQNLT